jgi:dTMP kinase
VYVASQTIRGGFFISFEGPEGAGKTTQIGLLEEVLCGRGLAVKVTREPGGTRLGERLRELLKHFDGPEGVVPEAELLMFAASRAQHMRLAILPHLAAGGVVLCDRFADSTTVYQGVARGLDRSFIEALHRFSIGGRWPDLTFLLDLDVDTGFARARRRQLAAPGPADRIEAESRAFHEAVRQGFLELAQAESQRFRVIAAAAPAEVVHARILEGLDRALG